MCVQLVAICKMMFYVVRLTGNDQCELSLQLSVKSPDFDDVSIRAGLNWSHCSCTLPLSGSAQLVPDDKFPKEAVHVL